VVILHHAVQCRLPHLACAYLNEFAFYLVANPQQTDYVEDVLMMVRVSQVRSNNVFIFQLASMEQRPFTKSTSMLIWCLNRILAIGEGDAKHMDVRKLCSRCFIHEADLRDCGGMRMPWKHKVCIGCGGTQMCRRCACEPCKRCGHTSYCQ
jgi:hypothetical protein